MVESKIVSLQDDDDNVNILVYGDSGVGKTILCGSDDKVLFIAPEDQGTLSAKRAGSAADKWPVRHWDDAYDAYEYLYDLSDGGTDGSKIPYYWLAVDSLTELQDLAMAGIMEAVVAENPDRDPDIPAQGDWLKYQLIVKRLVKGFNSLPVNVIYTALAKPTTMPDGTEKLIPSLQGKKDMYAKTVSSWMTAFGYMGYKRVNIAGEGEPANYEERRTITWKDTNYVTGKDRSMALEPRTVNKSLKDIRELIENYKDEQASKPVRRRSKPADPVDPEGDDGGSNEENEKESELIDA